ncbi:sensor histidine kinase [Amedibacillus dolichus]|uniref:sensor histidine kinase n=1 Tax=Amedibacillus dolichus TaxID=31971 RepID=UPI00242F0D9C|nr:histidine kinase [Amedibacillus dolichus]
MESKRSFKEKVEKANTWLTSIVFAVVILFCIISYWTASSYNRIFQGYRELQSYYDNVKVSSDELKKYLTSQDEENLKLHETSIHAAKHSLENILDNPVMEEKWRFRLLKNMLNEYENSIKELMEQYMRNDDPASYRDYYERFSMNEKLIQETSTTYYHLVTNAMSKQKEMLDIIQLVAFAMTAAMAIMMVFWVRYFSNLFYTTLSMPLQKVLKKISLIKKGRYDLEKEPQSCLEMEELCVALEEMAGKISHNMETQKEKAELEKRLAQSELKMLQNQINPHFLFNTLNMIYCMAEKEGAKEASSMLLKTSHLLRYGLEMQNRLSDFKRELHALQYYIDIQKLRFGDKLAIQVDVQDMEAIGNVAIPGMIFQPLIENAMKHGLKDCVKDGLIGIEICKAVGNINIKVFDNGQGMEKPMLKQLIENDYHAPGSTSLGLYNVVHRLKAYYAERVSIDIQSDIGCGFAIYISIEL